MTIQYNEIENELQRTKQLLLLQQHHNEEVSAQVTQISNPSSSDLLKVGDVPFPQPIPVAFQMDQLQTQLRQKSRLVEKMTSSESDYQVELQAARENLSATNKELSQKSNQVLKYILGWSLLIMPYYWGHLLDVLQLKVRMVELERERNKVTKLEEDLRRRDDLLSHSIVDAIRDGRIRSVIVDLKENPSAREAIFQMESKIRMLESQEDSLTHELQVSHFQW